MPPKNKKGGKKKDDDWGDDNVETVTKSLQKANVTDVQKKQLEEFSDDEEFAVKKPSKFILADDESNDEESKSDDEEEQAPQPSIKKEEPKGKGVTKGKKGKAENKANKKTAKEEEDLDALLAELDAPSESQKKKGKDKKPQNEPNIVDEFEKEDSLPKSEINGEKSTELEKPKEVQPMEENALANENNENLISDEVKKDKKKKKKDKKKKAAEDADQEEEDETTVRQSVEREADKNEEDKDEEMSDDEKDTDAKKKDKKKKKKEKEKEKKEKEKGKEVKGRKKQVELMKEILKKREEEEERARLAAEEEERRIEELQRQKEEEERLAKEKKEEAKRRKEELILQQKKEGTYLTKEQQKKKDKMMQMLINNPNFVLPPAVRGEGAPAPKKPDYGKKKPQKKSEQKKVEPVIEKPAETMEVVEEKISEEVNEEIVEPEVLDDWEMALDEVQQKEETTTTTPTPSTTKEVKTVKAVPEDKAEEEASTSESEESDEESSEDDESSSEDERSTNRETKEQLFERVRERIVKRREAAEAARFTNSLRSPVICVLGHVDTGKTKMLDTIRRTNVQDGEAGGITQQIGATRVPSQAIQERCKMVKDFDPEKMKIPGFLIIDTPGHESFANLRSRGSSLCDVAILVVDIMHGLEPQTIESIKLLIKRKTPFVIALNKIDRLYNYESNPRKDIWQHLKSQPNNTQLEFKERYEKVVAEFAEQGLNAILANKNNDLDEYISMVPTSAFLGDGIGNLMAYIVEFTQARLAKKLTFCDELDCTVMEVRSLPGLGTTIDVILVNGTLRVNDIIVLTGTEGAISTQIRDLLMPQALREIRVKNEYEHYKEIKGAQGVKILAKGLEKAVAGLPLFVANREDELDILREDAENQLKNALMAIKKKPEGVYVQASTLGSLEALLEFLRTQKIPYSGVNIGPVHKKDVQKAAAMLEHESEFACILAFDVTVDREVQQFADREGVRIFQADIIYHLEDSFLKYREELRLKRRRENEHLAIFPCKLRVLPQHIFNARNPIVIGVSIEAGQLKKGTPICVPSKDSILLGTVSSIEKNHEQVDIAKSGDEICVKIENTTGDAPKMYGRHFTHEDILVSRLTRESIDVIKTYFRDDLSKSDWQLVVQIKKLLSIL
uniref:Eukaryotic translation initiation factor 5B n=1 Tax=Acrobeloides nanus TaxID=290746 RepID=A0A914CAC0_9BILA